jgi:ubiquinone/menaquinone biosynthesis C-methylase UbiE
MQLKPSHDEAARQDFVYDLREFLTDKVYSRITPYYRTRVVPGFEKMHGRKPADKKEVRDVMLADQGYQSWSLLQRLSQQMMFTSVIDTVERTLPDLVEQSKKNLTLGSLRLDETVEIPKYLTAYDIHQQPGGYHSEHTEDDLAAGAIYDATLPIYSRGAMGHENDLLAQTIVKYINEYIADLRPKKILDLGCAIGNSTLPLARIFPEAEVFGIDVAAPCLRYAHARANALGVNVHFSQQNAEKTRFLDHSFDLIVSCLLLHETSHSAVPNIIRECSRILRPGGWMVHLDVYQFNQETLTPLEDFLRDWEVFNNNENFSGALREMDLQGIFERAGFAEDTIRFTTAQADVEHTEGYEGDYYFQLPVYVAQKELVQ